MQRWQSELTKHPLNTLVRLLLDILDLDFAINDPAIEVERTRFAKVVYFLRDTLRHVDPDIAPFDLLTIIFNTLQNHGVMEVVAAMEVSKDGGQFRELNTRLEPALSYIAQLRGSLVDARVARIDVEVATSSFEKYTQHVGQRLRNFESTIVALEAQGQAAAEALKVQEDHIDGLYGRFHSQIATWTDETNSNLSQQRDQFSALKTGMELSFSNAITAIKGGARAQLDDFFAKMQEEVRQKQDSSQAELSGVVGQARAMHSKIQEIYGLVARDAVAGGHQHIADREQSAAEKWRWATVASVGLTITWVFYSLLYSNPILEPERAFWLQVAKSASLTALMLSFAVYASKQAALHKVEERRARAFFLQIQAFDPFVANLEDADRRELKKEMSARIFGLDESQHDKAILENADFKAIDSLAGKLEQVKKLFGK